MSAIEADVVPFSSKRPFEMPEENRHRDDSRCLFTAGSLITENSARDRKHLRAGGVEIWNPCLRTSEMFVRRGRLTPLLMDSLTPIPAEEANTENSQFFIPRVPDEWKLPTYAGPTSGNSTGVLLGYPARPGDQIVLILQGPENVDEAGGRGLVEITELRGHDWRFDPAPFGGFYDPKIWEYQTAIFPEYPVLPTTLQEMRELVVTAARGGRNKKATRIAEEMLVSCDMFGSWAVRAIEEVHQAMNNAAARGVTFPYEQIHYALLQQLGMERQDLHFKRVAKPSQPMDAEGLIAVLKASREDQREEIKTLVAEIFSAMNSKGSHGA